MRLPIFRLFYSSTYTLLFLVTLALLLVSPGDGIFQSYRNNQLWNVVIIAGVYLATLLVALFIYATRIYTNRQHLASIPRSYIPIRKGDVSTRVRKLIEKGVARSALIAYNAHPRNLKEKENSTPAEAEVLGSTITGLDPGSGVPPPWGVVAHPGWSPPSSKDMPNVHYEPVLLEIPHLIEARAVSLAPPDPLADPTSVATLSPQPAVLPDPFAVSILQRPASQTLRDYLEHLFSLYILTDEELLSSFLGRYENARFSTRSLTEPEFRELMTQFSSLLRSMNSPDPELLAAMASSSSETRPTTSTRTSSIRSYSQASSVLKRIQGDPDFASPDGAPAARTPFTPYQRYGASISSNDGDRDDSGSERTAHTAWTRFTRQTRAGQRSASHYTAYTATGSGAYRTPGPLARDSSSIGGSDDGVGDEEGSVSSGKGSVIRKVPSNATGNESVGGDSVIVRRDAAEELDLPTIQHGDGLGIT